MGSWIRQRTLDGIRPFRSWIVLLRRRNHAAAAQTAAGRLPCTHIKLSVVLEEIVEMILNHEGLAAAALHGGLPAEWVGAQLRSFEDGRIPFSAMAIRHAGPVG